MADILTIDLTSPSAVGRRNKILTIDITSSPSPLASSSSKKRERNITHGPTSPITKKTASSSSDDVLSHLSNNSSVILNMYLSGGEIIDFMGAEEEDICKDISSKNILIKKEIGKGNFGTVYDISFDGGDSSKKYVLKKSNTETEIVTVGWFNTTISEYFDLVVRPDYPDVKKSFFLKMNGNNKSLTMKGIPTIKIPNIITKRIKDMPPEWSVYYRKTLSKFFDQIIKRKYPHTSKNIFIKLNGGDGNRKLLEFKKIEIPKYIEEDVSQTDAEDIAWLEKSSLSKYFDEVINLDYPGLSKTVFLKVNNAGNGEKPAGSYSVLVIPFYASLCKSDGMYEYPKNDGGLILNYLTIPPNSYMCANQAYTEYIISLLVSDYYKLGKCINFIDMLGFATCQDPKSITDYESTFSQYIFMEKIDLSLRSLLKSKVLNEDDVMSIILQTIFAIGCMQKFSSIMHNDLHCDNVFISNVTPDIVYNNKRISDYGYFHYSLGDGKDIYFPRGRFLVKIGDFGFSSKWSTPIVTSTAVINDDSGGWVPNFYSETYDCAYFLSGMRMELLQYSRKFKLDHYSDVFENIVPFIAQDDPEYMKTYYQDINFGYRPKLSMLNMFRSRPGEILDFMTDEYSLNYTPGENKYITIGRW